MHFRLLGDQRIPSRTESVHVFLLLNSTAKIGLGAWTVGVFRAGVVHLLGGSGDLTSSYFMDLSLPFGVLISLLATYLLSPPTLQVAYRYFSQAVSLFRSTRRYGTLLKGDLRLMIVPITSTQRVQSTYIVECRVSVLGIVIMIWESIPHNST